MRFFIASTLLLLLASCSGMVAGEKEIQIPGAPASAEETGKKINGRQYQVEDGGFVSVFMGKEESPEWSSASEDTSKHFKDYVAEQKKFSLQFVNDSIVKMVEGDEVMQAAYQLEKDTSSAVLLLIKVESKENIFPGATGPMIMTYTYKIRGIDDETIYLETPRQYNRRNVVYLMKKK